jgi:hypothetical protein
VCDQPTDRLPSRTQAPSLLRLHVGHCRWHGLPSLAARAHAAREYVKVSRCPSTFFNYSFVIPSSFLRYSFGIPSLFRNIFLSTTRVACRLSRAVPFVRMADTGHPPTKVRRESIRHDVFDWHAAAASQQNLDAMVGQYLQKPSSVTFASHIRANLPHLQLSTDGMALHLACATGVHEFQLEANSLPACHRFANFMLERVARGVASCPDVYGYDGYIRVLAQVSPDAQERRTLMLDTKRRLCMQLPKLPGVWQMLEYVFDHFGLPVDAWLEYLVGFHGLVQDNTNQTTFTWHDDATPTRTINQSVVTVVIQCTDTLSAMRVVSFEPFYYTRVGHACMFFGYAPHQTIPRKVDESQRCEPVVKCTFFLHPDKLCALQPSRDLNQVTRRQHYTFSNVPKDACLRFLRSRGELESKETGKPLTQTGFVFRSALISLSNMLQTSDGKMGDYPEPHFFVEFGKYGVTGIVWYSTHTNDKFRFRPRAEGQGPRPRPPTIGQLWCIAAYKGGGKALHDAFCEELSNKNVCTLEAPLAICKETKGDWFEQLGWFNPLSKARVADGDILYKHLDGLLTNTETNTDG